MTDSLGKCRVGVNLIDFHLPSDSQALVRESYVIIQNFWFSANLYCTLLPLSKYSMHKDTIISVFFLLPLHGYQYVCSLAQAACSVCHSLLHSAPSPFCSSSNSPTDQRNFKERCLNLLLFSLHKPQFTISFPHVSSQMFHSFPLWQRIFHNLEITAEIVAHLQDFRPETWRIP